MIEVQTSPTKGSNRTKKRLELCVLNWPASHAKNTCYPSTGCEKFRPSQVKRSLQCLPPRGRLFVSSIIKQIGRENTISAEICL